MFAIRILILLFTFSPITIAFSAEQQALKVLTWSGGETYLPRDGHPQDLELQLLQQFAKQEGLTFKQIKVEKFNDLFTKLLTGQGDVISANLTVTAQRKKIINFTKPFIQGHEYFLMGEGAKPLESKKDLNGREVVIQRAKSYHITALALQKSYPDMKVRYIDNTISTDLLYDRLASGEYDLAIQDDNLIHSALAYRDDIKRSLQASGKKNIAWALHPRNKKLLNQLNAFLSTQNAFIQAQHSTLHRWKHIKETKTIRFVLRNNLSSYYIWRGELLGFHYELAKRFAKEHKLRYEIVVAPDNSSLLDYIAEGKADIALGFLTPTEERKAKGIEFSIPYHYASELVIAHADAKVIETSKQLAGHSLYMRRSSSYWVTALELKKTVPDINLVPVPDTIETEMIIDNVGDKHYEMTIADSHIVDLEMTFRDDIQSFMALGEPRAQSWAIAANNTELMNVINRFLKKHYKGLFYNVIYNKYFKNKKRLDKQYNGYITETKTGVLSPYDELVKKYAKEYNFDWRLLVAQMHQESRFDPNARSMAGAKGLFQVMPRTAKELGIPDMHLPKQSIQAGIRYMDWVRTRMLNNDVQAEQLIWFTLASYNAGAGHVRDAMRLAKQKGWKGDVWFDHVEKAMLLLSLSKYASKARYGYVRGQEPVTYVRQIKRRLDTYINILDEKK